MDQGIKTMPTEKELLEREIAKLSGKSKYPVPLSPPIFRPIAKTVFCKLNDMDATRRCDRG